MAESDGDIEFLDEDADIVQQCVQAVPVQVPLLVPRVKEEKSTPTPLLVERLPAERKRKRARTKKDEEDSDYDPSDDNLPPSPPSPPTSKTKKKRQQVVKKIKTYHKESLPNLKAGQTFKFAQSSKTGQNLSTSQNLNASRTVNSTKQNVNVGQKFNTKQNVNVGQNLNNKQNNAGENTRNLRPAQGKKPMYFPTKEVVLDRKKCNIRIPDYDDPLCLPVRAIQYEESDVKRMNNWNNVCLEHFKHCDNLLKPERGETHSSTRTIVFRNVFNKQFGNQETTIWSKTCVENEDGDKKSEIFQCVLPRYKEKKVLTTFNLTSRKPKPYHLSDEVILSKEDGKDGEVLVAYKPKEATSAVYKLVATLDRKNAEQKEDAEDKEDDEDGNVNMYMKEIVYCKMCAPCYQTSWRGVKKNTKKSIACPICSRSFVTVYNLLAHFKTHSAEDIQSYTKVISAILAEIVDYHYKCRLCREQFLSIKKLRQHLSTHQGNEVFRCEVGNHMAR